MEGPTQPERKSDLELGNEIAAALDVMFEKYRQGEASLSDLLPLLNDIQRAQYNQLKGINPDLFSKEYDEVAMASLTPELTPYTHLHDEHPVREKAFEQVVEAAEFAAWYTIMRNSFPAAELPEKGTSSDVFKAVIRYILNTYGTKLKAETVTELELSYVLKAKVTPDDFCKAQDLVVSNLGGRS